MINTIGAIRNNSAAPSFVGLLDTYSGAAVAYSLRRLSGSYNGDCIIVRRSSDNLELAIGFDSNNVLDEAALLTHVGIGNDGYIVTMYDQSGGSNDITQVAESNQPKIVSSGVVILDPDTGKPSFTFPLGTTVLHTISLAEISFTAGWTFSFVAKASAVNVYSLIFSDAIGDAQDIQYVYGGGLLRTKIDGTNRNVYGTGTNSDSTRLWVNRRDASNNLTINRDAALYGSITGATGTFDFVQIGSNLSVNPPEYFSELIMWNSDKGATDVVGIETNINAHYSIYT